MPTSPSCCIYIFTVYIHIYVCIVWKRGRGREREGERKGGRRERGREGRKGGGREWGREGEKGEGGGEGRGGGEWGEGEGEGDFIFDLLKETTIYTVLVLYVHTFEHLNHIHSCIISSNVLVTLNHGALTDELTAVMTLWHRVFARVICTKLRITFHFSV